MHNGMRGLIAIAFCAALMLAIVTASGAPRHAFAAIAIFMLLTLPMAVTVRRSAKTTTKAPAADRSPA